MTRLSSVSPATRTRRWRSSSLCAAGGLGGCQHGRPPGNSATSAADLFQIVAEMFGESGSLWSARRPRLRQAVGRATGVGVGRDPRRPPARPPTVRCRWRSPRCVMGVLAVAIVPRLGRRSTRNSWRVAGILLLGRLCRLPLRRSSRFDDSNTTAWAVFALMGDSGRGGRLRDRGGRRVVARGDRRRHRCRRSGVGGEVRAGQSGKPNILTTP